MLVCAKGMLTKILKSFKFAPKNTSVREGFEVGVQLMRDAGSGNGEGSLPSLSLVDCLTRSLLLAVRFEARQGTDAVRVRRFCK